ncbi:helix-turn-helix domain-containing protein [Microbacterium testaceum]|uniref:helix-turn-helix domain-containing protein n=1 Tax=Microbacterium testaceum TaxID=2033 RepID=UPI001785D4BE|nr:helix-turn-helix domain-containing protein [Microbacterium testaceum]
MTEAKHRPVPAEFSTRWPDVVIHQDEAETARLLVLELVDAMGERSVRSLAKEADLDEKTLRKIIAGLSWPDLRTIARLEKATGRKLYPR